MTLIPKSSTEMWDLEVRFDSQKNFNHTGLNETKIPIPTERYFYKINTIKSLSEKIDLVKEREEGSDEIIITVGGLEQYGLLMRITEDVEEKKNGIAYPVHQKILAKKKSLLKLTNFTAEDEQALRNLITRLLGTYYPPEERLQKIYYFILEEFTRNEDRTILNEVLQTFEGSSYALADLMTNLSKLAKVPARTALGFRVDSKEKSSSKLKPIYFTEVMLQDKWHPISVNSGTFMSLPENTFVVFPDNGYLKGFVEANAIWAKATPIVLDKNESVSYLGKLAIVAPLYAKFSLHKLPVSLRAAFYTILLIPLGTLLLSMSRIFVGLKTFGIFTPVILGLFFHETSLVFGLIFFSVVILIGFIQRYILDRFFILAVARLSILIGLVIVSYALFSVLIFDFDSTGKISALYYFPIVIITVFIERLSVQYIEEGVLNTLESLLGTLLVSMICYGVFQIRVLGKLFFNHPELLFTLMGISILVGHYKGYRLMERWRFRIFLGDKT